MDKKCSTPFSVHVPCSRSCQESAICMVLMAEWANPRGPESCSCPNSRSLEPSRPARFLLPTRFLLPARFLSRGHD